MKVPKKGPIMLEKRVVVDEKAKCHSQSRKGPLEES